MTTKQKYREFCKQEKDIPIFSKDWWLDSVCEGDDWDVALVEKGGQIVASLPYIKTKRAIFDLITMPKLTQTLGVYIKYPMNQKYERRLSFEKKIINELILQLPLFDAFSQNFYYKFTNWLPFYWLNYKQTTRYTYIINDISSLDTVFNNFNKDYRTKIRKAEKTLIVKTDLEIKKFYEINMMVFKRQNISNPYNLDFLINHDNILAMNSARKIFYAEDENKKIHSALYLTWDNNSSYVHMVGEDPTLRNSSAGILLVWEAIKFTKNNLGLKQFDFEGSMIEGVEQVRRNFGAIQKPYFNISKTNSKLLKIREIVKEILK